MQIAVTSKSFSKNELLISELKKYFSNVRLNYATKKLCDDEVIEFLQDCNGAIVALEKINKKVIDALPKLKFIAKFGVGLDNIDLAYCNKKNIIVGYSDGTNKQSVAEQTLGFMLMGIRNLYIGAKKLSVGIWDKNGGYSLYGKTIGIIGVGNIGKEVVRLLQPFECKILVNDVIAQQDYYNNHQLIEVAKEQIYQQCDIITLHTPLNKQTKEIINKNSLSLMHGNTFLINTARGELINMNDLKDALIAKQIKGAAIDVFAQEPPSDLQLLNLDNIICTPHTGGNSKEAVLAMGRNAIKHLRRIT